jgi:hypothetical protein
MTDLSVFLHQHPALKLLQRDDTVYLAPNIPMHKLNNALNTYADTSVSPEQVILLIDDTVFGSGKTGLLVTATDLYIKEGFGGSRNIALNEINSIAFKPEFLTNPIHVNGQPFVQLAQPNKSTLRALCEILSDYIAQEAGHFHSGKIPDDDIDVTTATARANQTHSQSHEQQDHPQQQSTQTRQQSRQPQTDQKPMQQASKPAHDPEFEVGLICADILGHYALINDSDWTNAKLHLVRQFCDKFMDNAEQQDVLIERLKQTRRPALQESIHQLNRYEVDEDIRAFLLIQAYELLYLQSYHYRFVEQQLNPLAQGIGLSRLITRQILDELKAQPNRHGYATADDRDSGDKPNQRNHHNRTSETQSTASQMNSSIAQACQLLEIEPQLLNLALVQQAYRTKVTEFHPDKYHNLPEAVKTLLAEKTRELNQARQVLLDYLN